jgi:ribosomal protein S27E
MLTDLAQLKCGNCAGEQFKIYQDREHPQLVVECTSCQSTSIVSPTTVRLDIRFGEHSEGILCYLGDD